MLQKHRDSPSNKNIKDTVLENIELLDKSLDTLIKNKNLVYSSEDIESLFNIMKACEEYFEQYGLERPIGLQLRKAYLKVNSYLQSLREPLYVKTKELSDSNNVNQIYLCAYRKFLSENVQRVKKGLNPKTTVEEWNIDETCERGELQELALEDSLRHLRSGVAQNRGDLRNFYGDKSSGELMDEILTSTAKGMLDKGRKDLVKKIKILENIKEQEFSEEDLLVRSIIKNAEDRRKGI